MSHIIGSSSDHGRKREFISRRKFWMEAGMGIGGLALLDLLAQDGLLAAEASSSPASCSASDGVKDSLLMPKQPHFKPRAKSVISLFMSGGVSHVDTFAPKPALTKYAGQPLDGKIGGDLIVRQDRKS